MGVTELLFCCSFTSVCAVGLPRGADRHGGVGWRLGAALSALEGRTPPGLCCGETLLAFRLRSRLLNADSSCLGSHSVKNENLAISRI